MFGRLPSIANANVIIPGGFHIDSPSPAILFDQPISRLTALNMRFFASSINILLQDASFLIGSLDQISYALSLSNPIIHKDSHICLRSKYLSSPILLLIVLHQTLNVAFCFSLLET